MSLLKRRAPLVALVAALLLTSCSGGREEAERLAKDLEQQKAELNRVRAELELTKAEVERLSAGGPDGLDAAGVLTQSGDFTGAKFLEADKARGGVGGVYEIAFPRPYAVPPNVSVSRKMAPGAYFEVERLEVTATGFRYSSVTRPSDSAAQVTRWRARGAVK